MKRKLKDFLNKRVISGMLSAAIAFNMAAYLPISVFAHDDSPTESTVDLNEINVSGQLMSNGYLVYPDGSSSLRPESFTIKTVVTDPDTGIELANEITNFDNVSGQTYERIKLKQ